MKKLFTILCAAILSLGVSAQTESGNMVVGVNSNFEFASISPEGGDSESIMNLAASGGYFVADNIAVMALFGYAKMGDADATTSFGIGARYYMNSLYGGVAYIIPAEDMSTIHIEAGYVHMLTDNISLQPSLSYGMTSYDGEAAYSTLGLRIGFGLYF